MRTHHDFDLTQYNSYRLAAKCRSAYFPENEGDLIALYHRHKDYVLIGSGHNIIFAEAYYDREFIIFNGNLEAITVHPDGVLEAECGATMLDIAVKAMESGLSGLEIFYDIPSSLGGAVVMNAGASGEEIKDVLVKVRYLDLADMQVKEIAKADMGFEYRNSFFQRNTDKVVLKAWMQLRPSDAEAIREKMETIKEQRWAKQPKEFPNAGSVFKRPPGYYVGAIMEELQMKGFTVGGAKISEKHGGFIVNFNQATGRDILTIIQTVKQKVFERYGVDLEVEQRII